MELNTKVKCKKTDASLPLRTFQRCQRTITEVNEQYKEFLTQEYDGQNVNLITVNDNNNNIDKHKKPQILGLECNQNDSLLPAPSTSNQSQRESHKFEPHKKLKNSNINPEIHRKMMPNLLPDNQKWKISYYPSKTELLCDTCGQTFTYISTLQRHMQLQHKPRNLICHECDYQTPRRDNMRRHLRIVHKLVKVGEVLNNLHKVCISRSRPLQAIKATKDLKNLDQNPLQSP